MEGISYLTGLVFSVVIAYLQLVLSICLFSDSKSTLFGWSSSCHQESYHRCAFFINEFSLSITFLPPSTFFLLQLSSSIIFLHKSTFYYNHLDLSSSHYLDYWYIYHRVCDKVEINQLEAKLMKRRKLVFWEWFKSFGAREMGPLDHGTLRPWDLETLGLETLILWDI